MNRSGGVADRTTSLLPARSWARTRRRFRSPLEAQRWYEWRMFGWQLPACAALMLAIYFIGMPVLVAVFKVTNITGESSGEPLFFVDWFTSAQFVTSGLQITAVIAGLVIGGFMFMRAGQWNTHSNFLLTRPISTRALANARILMAARSVVSALAVLAAALLVLIAIARLRSEPLGVGEFLHQGFAQYPRWAIWGFFWGSLLIALWVGIWSVNLGFLLFVYAILLGVPLGSAWLLSATGVNTVTDFGRDTAWIQEAGTWLAAITLVCGGGYMAVRAIQWKVTAPWVVAVLPLLWIAYFGTFYVYAVSFSAGFDAQPWSTPWPIRSIGHCGWAFRSCPSRPSSPIHTCSNACAIGSRIAFTGRLRAAPPSRLLR